MRIFLYQVVVQSPSVITRGKPVKEETLLVSVQTPDKTVNKVVQLPSVITRGKSGKANTQLLSG